MKNYIQFKTNKYVNKENQKISCNMRESNVNWKTKHALQNMN